MGLPGSGKTTLAKQLVELIGNDVYWLNADDIRKTFNDWDFSTEGRLRQAHRMRKLADESKCKYIIVDFVAPLHEMRDIFQADYTVWVDTIKESRFQDTDFIFEKPTKIDMRIDSQNAIFWAKEIWQHINK